MFHWEKWTRKLIQPCQVIDCDELEEGGVDEEHADKIPPGSDFCNRQFETNLIKFRFKR